MERQELINAIQRLLLQADDPQLKTIYAYVLHLTK